MKRRIAAFILLAMLSLPVASQEMAMLSALQFEMDTTGCFGRVGNCQDIPPVQD